MLIRVIWILCNYARRPATKQWRAFFVFGILIGMGDAKKIEDISTWKKAKAYFLEHGYSFFQSQHDADEPEGFHAWFINGKRDIEIVTHDPIIRDEIIEFNSKNPPPK